MKFPSETIKMKILKLDSNKTPGPDLLHSSFLKSLVEHICEPLSMSSGKLPNEWLNAIITAVHKKGDRSLCGNYRPISLTCVIIQDNGIHNQRYNRNAHENKQSIC